MKKRKSCVFYSLMISDDNSPQKAVKKELLLAQLCQSIDSIVPKKRSDIDILVFIDEDDLHLFQHEDKWRHIQSNAKIIPFTVPSEFRSKKGTWQWQQACHKWFHFKTIFEDLKYGTALFLDCDTIATRNISYIFDAPHKNDAMYTCKDKWCINEMDTSGFVEKMIKTGKIESTFNSGQFLVSRQLYETHMHKLHKNNFKSYLDCVEQVQRWEKPFTKDRLGNRWLNEQNGAHLWLYKNNVPMIAMLLNEFLVIEWEDLDVNPNDNCPKCKPNHTFLHYGSHALWMIHPSYWDKLHVIFDITHEQLEKFREIYCICGRHKEKYLDILTDRQHTLIHTLLSHWTSNEEK